MTDAARTPAQIRSRFLAERGSWPPAFDHLVELDPDFVEAYLDFSMVPWHSGALEPKVKEFVYIAIDIAATHLHEEGARAHIAAAFRHGATIEELVQVCELVFMLGAHTMMMAGPILAEELAAAGQPVPTELTAEQEEIRTRYVADRGMFPPPLAPVLAMDPAFIDAYRAISAIPAKQGHLDPKTIEFVLIAVDASTTHLHATGTRAHIRRALALGASAAEVLEVLELTSVLGIHGTNLGVGLVVEEYGKIESEPTAARPAGQPTPTA